MRAVTCQAGDLSVVDLPDPEPGPGQVVLRVRRTGICGSDLHARHHADELAAVMSELDYHHSISSGTATVLGHELCGEVLAHGRGTARAFPEGTRVAVFPLLRTSSGVHPLGLSPEAPGGYAEQVLVEASMLHRVPDGLDDDLAALTEPMAVARHAVNKGAMARGNGAVVLGCGPIGLAVIAVLRADGHEGIVAADFSPRRRRLAEAMGADVVVDPAENPAIGTWLGRSGPGTPLVIYECVGVPGVIGGALQAAPSNARLVVVGVCMETDQFDPLFGILKEVSVHFVFGYQPDEFAATLRALAEGELDVDPMVTGTVGIDGVAGAFDELRSPETHAKILVTPDGSPA